MSEVKRYGYLGIVEEEDGEVVKYEDYAAIKAERDALAAENVALKANLMFWDAEDPEDPYDHPEEIANNCAMELHTEFDVQVAAKMPNRTYRVSDVGDYDCTLELVSGGMPETPATDAYLNSVRAEGVEMFANEKLKLSELHARNRDIEMVKANDYCAMTAEEFANQLRAGEPS